MLKPVFSAQVDFQRTDGGGRNCPSSTRVEKKTFKGYACEAMRKKSILLNKVQVKIGPINDFFSSKQKIDFLIVEKYRRDVCTRCYKLSTETEVRKIFRL